MILRFLSVRQKTNFCDIFRSSICKNDFETWPQKMSDFPPDFYFLGYLGKKSSSSFSFSLSHPLSKFLDAFSAYTSAAHVRKLWRHFLSVPEKGGTNWRVSKLDLSTKTGSLGDKFFSQKRKDEKCPLVDRVNTETKNVPSKVID